MSKVYLTTVIVALVVAWCSQTTQAQNPPSVDELKRKLERVEREPVASPGPYPEWVNQLITEFQRGPATNPPRGIWQYNYKGQVVYGVGEGYPDAYYTIYDINRKVICAPSGGLTGHGDGRCPDFNLTATDAKLLWRGSQAR